MQKCNDQCRKFPFSRLEPKYLNVLFVMSLLASILCNICFLALKVVRVKELQKNDFTIMKVTIKIIKM